MGWVQGEILPRSVCFGTILWYEVSVYVVRMSVTARNCLIIFTPHACARGSLSVSSLSARKSPDFKFWASVHNELVDISVKNWCIFCLACLWFINHLYWYMYVVMGLHLL